MNIFEAINTNNSQNKELEARCEVATRKIKGKVEDWEHGLTLGSECIVFITDLINQA